MGRNDRNEGGGTDGISPDAEIERLSREDQAQQAQREADAQRAEQRRQESER